MWHIHAYIQKLHFLRIDRLGWKETRGKNNHLKEELEHWKFRDVSSDEQERQGMREPVVSDLCNTRKG